MKLYLGEGMKSVPATDKIRIDIVPRWADIVWDLNNGMPKLDQKFDYVEASHVFEHIESGRVLKGIINDIYDLMTDGGEFHIRVPFWKSDSAVECIEHCRFFNKNSFMNFYDNPYAEEMGMKQFKLVEADVVPSGDGHMEVKVILKK